MSSEFFELLATKGLRGDDVDSTLDRLSQGKLLDLTAQLQEELPYVKESAESRFGFLASSTLSGGPVPCSQVSCRLDKADELARFASLYADEVLIRDPFAQYSTRNNPEFLRSQLAADLHVLEYLRPLIQEGLVGIAPTSFLLCEEHLQEILQEEEKLKSNLDIAADVLAEQYMPQLTFSYESTGFVGIRGPESLIPHGSQYVGPLAPETALERGEVRYEVKRMLLYRMLNPILDDVFLQDHYKNHYQYRYLTDRDLDIDVIDAIGGQQIRSFNQALLDGLKHVVPVVGSVDVSTLVSLRREEGEAFQVYRDALARVLRDADLSTAESIKEAFDDAIRPEINKINLAAANARKLQKRELKRDIAVSGGIISVGLLLGLIQPAVAVVAAALGGYKAARDIGGKVADLVLEPAKVRENGFYFLWRLQNADDQPMQIDVRE